MLGYHDDTREEDYADRIRLVPAWLELDDRIMEAGIPGSHLRLVKGLQGADDDFDETILDCPPSLSHLTQLALAASHQAIAVTEAEQDSIRGARRVLEFIAQKSYALHNEDLKVTGVVVTRMDATRAVDRSQLSSAREIFPLWPLNAGAHRLVRAFLARFPAVPQRRHGEIGGRSAPPSRRQDCAAGESGRMPEEGPPR
jgi:cellulose biosynthesis protein BcsQ